MPRVYVSIGSNIDREQNITSGITALRVHFDNVVLSPVYESTSVGFDGDNFYNLVAGFHTEKSMHEVVVLLNQIEDENGRTRNGPRFSSRTLDIDLLLYDDVIFSEGKLVIPRTEIYDNAFVLKPLMDIAPDLRDPLKKQSYRQLWEQYHNPSQQLWVVDLKLN